MCFVYVPLQKRVHKYIHYLVLKMFHLMCERGTRDTFFCHSAVGDTAKQSERQMKSEKGRDRCVKERERTRESTYTASGSREI